MMSPGLRKLALTVHVVSSVGWLGAVAVFLALSVAGLTSPVVETVRAAYMAMNTIGAWVIVPLSFAALLSGIVQALGTQWGLFRYYWVVFKFGLTVVATLLLMLHQFTAVAAGARRAAGTVPDALPELGGLGSQLAVDAGAAILLLLVTTTISVYKPWGRTSYGRSVEERAQSSTPVPSAGTVLPAGVKIFLAAIGVIVAAMLVVHLAGGGMGHH